MEQRIKEFENKYPEICLLNNDEEIYLFLKKKMYYN